MMFDKNKSSANKTETALAISVLLLNICVLAATFAVGWASYWLITQSSKLELILSAISPN